MYKIKVKNTRTEAEYVHDNITEEDLSWIKMTPTLEIKILKTYKDNKLKASDNEKKLSTYH